MPGMRCTVADCNNSRINVDKSGKKISFYRFPKNKTLRQLWVEKCRRGGKWNPETCRVCSDHFSDADYERNLQAELLNLPVVKKKLKATAVPSLKLFKEVVAPPILERELNEHITEASSQATNNSLESDILKEEHNYFSEDYMTIEDTVLTSSNNPSASSEASSNLIESEILKEESKYIIEDYMTTENTVLSPPVSSASSLEIPEKNKYEGLLQQYEAVVKENDEIKKQLKFSNEVNENLMRKLHKVENELAHRTKEFILQNSQRI